MNYGNCQGARRLPVKIVDFYPDVILQNTYITSLLPVMDLTTIKMISNDQEHAQNQMTATMSASVADTHPQPHASTLTCLTALVALAYVNTLMNLLILFTDILCFSLTSHLCKNIICSVALCVH